MVFKHKISQSSYRGGVLKYLDNWNPISQRFISRVKEKFSNSSNTSIQTTCKLPQISSRGAAWFWGSQAKGFLAVARESVGSVQSLSRIRLFATPWIAARQASLSITISRNSLRITSIESVMPSSHLILGRPLPLSRQSNVSAFEYTT